MCVSKEERERADRGEENKEMNFGPFLGVILQDAWIFPFMDFISPEVQPLSRVFALLYK